MSETLYYIHDPMCSWCWGFKPVLAELLKRLPENIEVKRLLGGLAVDSDQPMPEEMKYFLQQTWGQIQEKIPGTEFNFDFWQQCEPRRSTWPSCRAVIAARLQGKAFDVAMTEAIQQAYYLEAKNPSDDDTLINLASNIGLDLEQFIGDFKHQSAQQQLDDEMKQGKKYGAQGFPSLIYVKEGSAWPVAVNYQSAEPMLDLINQLREF